MRAGRNDPQEAVAAALTTTTTRLRFALRHLHQGRTKTQHLHHAPQPSLPPSHPTTSRDRRLRHCLRRQRRTVPTVCIQTPMQPRRHRFLRCSPRRRCARCLGWPPLLNLTLLPLRSPRRVFLDRPQPAGSHLRKRRHLSPPCVEAQLPLRSRRNARQGGRFCWVSSHHAERAPLALSPVWRLLPQRTPQSPRRRSRCHT